jgi:hypothetical protein
MGLAGAEEEGVTPPGKARIRQSESDKDKALSLLESVSTPDQTDAAFLSQRIPDRARARLRYLSTPDQICHSAIAACVPEFR